MKEEFLSPEYDPAEFEHPAEFDSDIVEENEDEDDIDMSDLRDDIEREEELQRDNRMNNNQFSGSSSGGFGSNTVQQGQQQVYPWQQQRPSQSSNPVWGWGNNNNNTPTWGSSSYWGSQQNNQNQFVNPEPLPKIPRPKRVVICDVLDVLVESLSSENRPNILPRAIFDIKLKFDVWDKIASFGPEQVYMIYPQATLDGLIGGKEGWEIAIRYISYSLATYLRIPQYNCIVVKQMIPGQPKSVTLLKILELIKNKKDAVFVGLYSGYYGLSNMDKVAADQVGIDYADLWQLIKGEI